MVSTLGVALATIESMLSVDQGSPFCALVCSICHEQIKPGDLVLAAYHRGTPKAIHAHVCRSAQAEKPVEPTRK
ncbi:MAG TPA: hypothetical protein VF752_16735 [Thermoleophilaceae bacterium]